MLRLLAFLSKGTVISIREKLALWLTSGTKVRTECCFPQALGAVSEELHVLGLVAQVYDVSYLGGRGRKIISSKPSRTTE